MAALYDIPYTLGSGPDPTIQASPDWLTVTLHRQAAAIAPHVPPCDPSCHPHVGGVIAVVQGEIGGTCLKADGSVGRAPRLHCGGYGFESHSVHHHPPRRS